MNQPVARTLVTVGSMSLLIDFLIGLYVGVTVHPIGWLLCLLAVLVAVGWHVQRYHLGPVIALSGNWPGDPAEVHQFREQMGLGHPEKMSGAERRVAAGYPDWWYSV